MNLRLDETAEKIAARATLGAIRILAHALDSQLRRLRRSDDALTQTVVRIKCQRALKIDPLRSSKIDPPWVDSERLR
jgi:hypothetical protein